MDIRKYGFCEWNKEILPEGVKNAYWYEKDSLTIAFIGEPLVSRLIDGKVEEAEIGIGQTLGSYFDCKYLLLVWSIQEELQLIAYSNEKRVRAYEFLDYIISDFGLVKGNAQCARGRVSSVYLSVQMSEMELVEQKEYFFAMCQNYFEVCDWINAEDYWKGREEELTSMSCYQKKRIPWAYVKTTDIVEAGKKFYLRSLENESGIMITSREDSYIMIGCRGEVYDISRGKFESTYDRTDTPLDIYEQMLDFIPEVQLAQDGSYVSIDEIARLCYPKTDAKIYASKLKKRTKIFPKDESQEYYLGRKDDYMAVRMDDFEDIYIIQEDIFHRTYEKIEQE